MNIFVLGGGSSPEREVSLRSAKSVAKAARAAGFTVFEYDPANGLKFLGSISETTLVFPILHGEGGEDGALQLELEKRKLPYLGSDSASSIKCFDKWQTRLELEKANISVAEGGLVTAVTYPEHPLTKKPHVLKVVHGGSSIGTIIVRDPKKISKTATQDIFKLEKQAVIEKLVEGIEITIPIFDQKALPAIEVHPPQGGEFDYENKYNGQSAELCPPPSISADQHRNAQLLAERVHKAMKCSHLSRVDTIMRPDGGLVVLEINTMPGMTDQSLYPKSASVAGIAMPELIKKFVDLIVRDYKIKC